MPEMRLKDELTNIYIDWLNKKITNKEKNDNILNVFGYKNREELCKDGFYLQYNNVLTELSKMISPYLDETDDDCIQAKIMLIHLWEKWKEDVDKEEFDILSKMIESSIYANWSDDCKKLFDKGSTIIKNWKDYFISYTRRGLPAINKEFEQLIEQCLTQKDKEKSNDNIHKLVVIIDKCLKENNLTGYYDENDFAYGDVISKTVNEYCTQSFTFIQLLERLSFRKLAPKEKNWCFEEYKEFKQNLGKYKMSAYMTSYFQFLIPHELSYTLPKQLPSIYRGWVNDCFKTKYFEGLVNYQNSFHCFQMEMDKIADSILKAREQFISSFSI